MSQNGDGHADSAEGERAGGTAFDCPGCGERVEAEVGEVARLVECPGCGQSLVIPAEDGSTDLLDTAVDEEQQKQDELDSLRMRHMIVTRRTAIRTRTYFVAGAVACLIGAVQLVIMTVTEVRIVGWHLRQVAFLFLAVVGLWAAVHFFRRAAYWGRQSRAATITDPETPPDFSTLSDGSQHARNLENLH